MKRALLAGALIACGSSSSGAPPRDAPAARPPPADAAVVVDQRAYKAALKRGWDLAHAGDQAGAVAAFQAALAVKPDDPRALVELSWAALHADDLELARQSADRAIGVSTDRDLRAQAYYNRGRAEEAGYASAAALADYLQSLALRPNRTVAQRIGALGGPEPSSIALVGPFAELSGFCAELGLPASEVGDPTLEDDAWCAPAPLEVPAARALPAGFDRITEVRHAESSGAASRDLALHTSKGWYVLADYAVEDRWPGTQIGIVETHGDELDIMSSSEGDQMITRCKPGAPPSCEGPYGLPR